MRSPGAEAERRIELFCTEAQAQARKAEIKANGLEPRQSWQCNDITPSMIRGFALTPRYGLQWTETEP